MGQLEKEQIIVLKSIPFLESDLIVHGINDQGATKHFIAKGALKSTKRFTGGVLEPTSFIKVEYRVSKSLNRLREAWLLNDFKNLRKDYDRLQMALYFVKVISQISQEGITDSKELFHLLGNALSLAESSSSLPLLKTFFQIKLLFIQGVLPPSPLFSKILQSSLKDHLQFKIDTRTLQTLSSKADAALHQYIGF